jgi:heme oxygenase
LRQATAETHDRIELRLDMMAALADPARRVALMQRFWGLHRGAEQALACVLAGVADLDYPSRSKVAFLEDDLVALTGARPNQHEPVCRFAVASRAAGLGIAYVLEGSALGGAVIHRDMLARGMSPDGLSFFNPYGSQTGPRWREFIAVIEREGQDEGAATQIIAGARHGFSQVEDWLCRLMAAPSKAAA